MLDPAGTILRAHYKTANYDVSFSQGSVSYLGEVDMFFTYV